MRSQFRLPRPSTKRRDSIPRHKNGVYVGVTERDVTNSLVVNLAGSSQVAPTYWLNPENNVSYPIVMQTPQYQIDSLGALKNLPITAAGSAPPQILGGIADISR